MSSERLYRELQSLERKIQLVISENQKLKEDLYKVKNERNNLESQLESYKENIDSFQNQIKISKIVNNMIVSEGDTETLKEKIDGYIKEIDNCIAHLAEK